MNESAIPVFLQGRMNYLREMQGVLREAQIQAEIVQPPGAHVND